MIEKIERRNTIRKYVMIIIAIVIGFIFFAMCTSRCFDTNYYGGTGTEYEQRKRDYNYKKEYWKNSSTNYYDSWYF